MNNSIVSLPQRNTNPFDAIKHIDQDGNEYWFARELQPLLEYDTWRRFEDAIDRAKISCEASKYVVSDHFVGDGKMIDVGKGAKRGVTDYRLTRYACYLIAMNGDVRKPAVALAQTYFAMQTRRQEIADQKALSPLDALQGMLDQLRAQDTAIKRLESQALVNTRSVAEIREQLLDADYFSIRQWCSKQRIQATYSVMQRWGKEAAKLSRENNIEIKEVAEGMYTVGRYHKSILQSICVPKPKGNGQLPLLKDGQR